MATGKAHGDPRELRLMLPHLPSEMFGRHNHERDYPHRLGISLDARISSASAREAYRKGAIGYCDVREDLDRFLAIDPGKGWPYVAVAFEDGRGMFWFHFSYLATCIIDAETGEDAEVMWGRACGRGTAGV